MKTLGSKNHEKDADGDTWRYPLDKPARVLSVTRPQGTYPRGQQCRAPPASARAIVIISFMTRPDSDRRDRCVSASCRACAANHLTGTPPNRE